jgi:DeoR/GlpR family transcriptional regulator of sugar metabolism
VGFRPLAVKEMLTRAKSLGEIARMGVHHKPGARQREIAEIVAAGGAASVEALSRRFAVSAETIRRDLSQLAAQGAVQKVHGGARPLPVQAEGSFAERMRENAAAKRIIADKLAALIEPGETIFLDTGSTTLAAAHALVRVPRLTVITNALRIAEVLGAGGARVFLLGGSYAPGNGQTVGPAAIAQIDRFQADRAVITVAGLDAAAGATDADFDEAHLARAMIDRAASTVVLAHQAKFGRRAAFRVCGLDEIGLVVCDEPPGGPLARALRGAGVRVD